MQTESNGGESGKRIILDWLTKDRQGPGALPTIMKLVMIFIDRIGFPILAFLIMTAGCFFVIYKMLPLLEGINRSLSEVVVLLKEK